MLPTLIDCLQAALFEQLPALDLWLKARQDVTISVGVILREHSRRCTLHVHGQTFSMSCSGNDYATSWAAIVGALTACEQFERATGEG